MFRWYAVNTYSGHENKVKQNLEHRVVSLGQQRNVRQIVIPTENVSEMKDGQKIQIERRTMPGYVLVNMDLNEDSWTLSRSRSRSPSPRSTACSTARPPSGRAHGRSSRWASR